jgi:hypothetical protein
MRLDANDIASRSARSCFLSGHTSPKTNPAASVVESSIAGEIVD